MQRTIHDPDVGGKASQSLQVLTTRIRIQLFHSETVHYSDHRPPTRPNTRTYWQAAQVAEVLKDLLRGSDESALLAYQIAFDLVESEHQHFVMEVNKHMPQKKATEAVPAAESGEEKREGTEGDAEAAAAAPAEGEVAAAAASGMEVDSEVHEPEESEEFLGRMDKLRQVLVDGFGIDLSLNFLYKMNKTDLLLMKNIKGALETRNSVLHNVTVVAHGYMQAGTTVSVSGCRMCDLHPRRRCSRS